MALRNLNDVYLHQLQDMYSADRQALAVTRRLANLAKDEHLVSALDAGVEGIRRGMKEMEQLLARHGADTETEHSEAMEGIVAEIKHDLLEAEFDDPYPRDAMIAAQYQRMAHFAIAGYGTALAFAQRLGLTEDAGQLKKNLDTAYSGDRTMTQIANGNVNQKAA
ncbi:MULTISPECIES: DUF892 family protein [unclassified Roseitalea]|uniref:YciE/YciF ferroxidase family protein n=1 Tax=unclassified Roseitalea TaxID=2639107 RepID=UPI00273D2D4A|nr:MULTISPECIES: DUF892 family protein [unclassified Roseitalea]